ncbi:MAG: rhamnulokinase [Prevotellaceae bacterium]|jgi:rhamnulokinase|nr:rhamnulokinase [Prevotellaceae bacterium]
MKPLHLLAFDLGATSGRSMLGTLKDSKFSLREVTRFPNAMFSLHGKSYWNIFSLYDELKKGIAACVKEGVALDAVGIDTWGVDFALLDSRGDFLSLPRAYRDPYTQGIQPKYFERISSKAVYEKTGIQFMDFNSLFQLFALSRELSPVLAAAKSLLFMPDALTYMLCGKKICEYTIASTSQLLNPRTKQIEASLLEAMGLSASLLQPITQPATVVGTLTEEVQRETGAGPVPVVAVAGHDTGSAIAAVPADSERFAYLSSGTWSLMGIEVKEPIINDSSFALNYTNEGGVEGTTRFLKNITGMWLLEECRREWAKAGSATGYAELTALAEASPFRSAVDPDDPSLAKPASMTAAIADCCRRTGQPAPATQAEFARCIFESLARKYKLTLENLKALAPFAIERLHVIGGGSQNALLNRLTEEAIGLPVVAGPVEATAIGNIMLQAKALGAVGSLSEMRGIIRQSL